MTARIIDCRSEYMADILTIFSEPSTWAALATLVVMEIAQHPGAPQAGGARSRVEAAFMIRKTLSRLTVAPMRERT
jgi:hypothetical protein